MSVRFDLSAIVNNVYAMAERGDFEGASKALEDALSPDLVFSLAGETSTKLLEFQQAILSSQVSLAKEIAAQHFSFISSKGKDQRESKDSSPSSSSSVSEVTVDYWASHIMRCLSSGDGKAFMPYGHQHVRKETIPPQLQNPQQDLDTVRIDRETSEAIIKAVGARARILNLNLTIKERWGSEEHYDGTFYRALWGTDISVMR